MKEEKIKKRIEFKEGCHKFCSCEMLFIDGVAVVDSEDLEILFDFIFFFLALRDKELLEKVEEIWKEEYARKVIDGKDKGAMAYRFKEKIKSFLKKSLK